MTGNTNGESAAGVSTLSDDSVERLLIGCLVIEPDIIDDLGTMLSRADFSGYMNGTAYQAVLNLHDRKEGIDWATVTNEVVALESAAAFGGRDKIENYLKGVCNEVPSSFAAPQYADIIKDYAQRRRIRDLGFQLSASAQDKGVETAELAHGAGDALERILDSGVLDDGLTMGADAVAATRARIAEGQKDTLQTGYTEFDFKTGGWSGGQLIVIGARPGVGKSAAATNIMNRCIKAKPLLFTLEMSKEEVVTRMVASRGRVNSRLYARNELPEGQAKVAAHVEEQLCQEQFIIDDTPALSIKQICAKTLKLARKGHVGLVIVDYLGLVRGSGRYQERRLEVADVCHRLKALAREIDAPVLALSQLSRNNEQENRPPRLTDLRESGDIEQDADMVLALHRHEEGTSVDKVKWMLLKNRHGPTGEVMFNFNKQYVHFEEDRG